MVRGLGADAPKDRGAAKITRTPYVREAWPRGKSHEKGMPFPFFVPPLKSLKLSLGFLPNIFNLLNPGYLMCGYKPNLPSRI